MLRNVVLRGSSSILKVAALRCIARLSFVLLCVSAGLFSCTKIEYTTLGVDLVPEVNNLNTFDTTLDVTTENFVQTDDTLKPNYYDQLAVGRIVNDPLFGNTNAAVFFELKPPSFSAYSTAKNFIDSSLLTVGDVGYDSTVLSIKYDGGYGDTSREVEFQVYLLTDTITRLTDRQYPLVFRADSLLSPTQLPIVSKKVSLHSLAYDSVYIYRSSTLSYKKTGELRFRLPDNTPWINLLKDTLALGDDVTFRTKLKGFAIKVSNSTTTPGSLAYFSISDTATRLQFYYRRKNAGVIDTTSTSFYFNHNNSGFANNVVWENKGAGREVSQHLGRVDSLVYVKANPGTQTRIRIPGLEKVSNRIIHRAELRTYIIPNNPVIDGFLTPPPVLYLERYDTTTTTAYLPIPIDLNPNELYGTCFPISNGINYSYFGGYPRSDSSNTSFQGRFYAFNISRYVQQIVTHQLTNSPLRLTANIYAQYANCSGGLPIQVTNNIVGYGRAKLGGGGLKGTLAPYKMRLRIVYSKI